MEHEKNVPGCSRDARVTPTTNDNSVQPRMTYKKNNNCIYMSLLHRNLYSLVFIQYIKYPPLYKS